MRKEKDRKSCYLVYSPVGKGSSPIQLNVQVTMTLFLTTVSLQGTKWHISYRKGFHVEDEEVKGHGEADGSQQPHILPGRHTQQGLVL